MKKVSFIVPIYNCEKFLEKNLNSLVNQTLNDIEIICINDGSTDNSPEILKNYCNRYPDKITVVNKQNEGVWYARLDGIKNATGEFICFADSDDYVAFDFAEKLYNAVKLNNSDIAVCGFSRIDMDTGHIYSREMCKTKKDNIDVSKNPEGIIQINGALWNKIFKADLLRNIANIDEPPKVLEDMMFFLLAFLNVKKISFIPDCLYYYMVRPNSAMSTVDVNQIDTVQNAMVQVRNIYSSSDVGKKYLTIVDSVAFLHFGISLMFRISYDKSVDFNKCLKQNREFLNKNFPNWKKSKYLGILYNFCHGFANIKIAVMKKIYVLNLLPTFLKIYRFMIAKLKIDIKW